MTFRKPTNITYTQMCIYIDDNIYNGTYDENTVYTYLYLLTYMLAKKMKYFEHEQDYDEFSLYMASRLYMRLTNSNKSPIKSILNYLKRTIGVQRLTWEEKYRTSTNKNGNQIFYFDTHNIANSLVDETSLYDYKSYETILTSLESIVSTHLRKIPFKKESSEWYNIYLSVILTLIDSITPNKEQLTSILEATDGRKEHLVNNIYSHLRNKDPIVFHLDESMKHYIKVLVMEVRHAIAAEFSETHSYYISSEDIMKNLLINEYTESNPSEY